MTIKATLSSVQAGTALLSITFPPDSKAQEGIAEVFLENSDHKYLSEEAGRWAWSDIKSPLPLSFDESGNFHLSIGPFEENLFPQRTYAFTVVGKGGKVFYDRFHSPAIPPLPFPNRETFFTGGAGGTGAAATPGTEPGNSKVEAPTERNSSANWLAEENGGKDPLSTLSEELQSNADKNESGQSFSPSGDKKKSSQKRKLIAALLILLAVLGLGALLWNLLPGESPGPEPLTISKPKGTIREQVREFFEHTEQRTPQDAFKLAQSLEPKTAEDEDALFRLYYFAVEGKDKRAYKPYAEYLDPSLAKKGSIDPDPEEALSFYEEAGDRDGYSRLKKWLEENRK